VLLFLIAWGTGAELRKRESTRDETQADPGRKHMTEGLRKKLSLGYGKPGGLVRGQKDLLPSG